MQHSMHRHTTVQVPSSRAPPVLRSQRTFAPRSTRRFQKRICLTSRAAQQEQEPRPSYLSDVIAFESEDPTGVRKGTATQEPKADGSQLVNRAEAALAAARQALENARERAPVRPSYGEFVFQSRTDWAKVSTDSDDSVDLPADATESALHNALTDMHRRGDNVGSNSATANNGSKPEDSSSQGSPPSWASGVSSDRTHGGWSPQLQQAQPQTQTQPELTFAEPSFATFDFLQTQSEQDAEYARNATLPPLESVLELTDAVRPPLRGEEPQMASTSGAGRALEDGKGSLADGTQFDRQSGEERGPNGYWFRWHRLKGKSGKVEWEEYWWEASDWAGMKELGAEKSGCSADGAAWRETWREAIAFDPFTGEPTVERTAHKWAHDAKGDEWEEKWGEWWASMGRANKWADKWAKDGTNVWHEKWGEEYDGEGGCVKFTDKWAERLLQGGETEQWGDKWEERFKEGKGTKKGETWSVDGGANRYQQWWGENHFGNGWVQKYGNSTNGDNWDVSEEMDTYYNPIPVGGYDWALSHSPQLKGVAALPRGGDELGDGLDVL
ncbi:hypothetical protein WJX79_009019 [Trebouxia sp. C0005]